METNPADLPDVSKPAFSRSNRRKTKIYRPKYRKNLHDYELLRTFFLTPCVRFCFFNCKLLLLFSSLPSFLLLLLPLLSSSAPPWSRLIQPLLFSLPPSPHTRLRALRWCHLALVAFYTAAVIFATKIFSRLRRGDFKYTEIFFSSVLYRAVIFATKFFSHLRRGDFRYTTTS